MKSPKLKRVVIAGGGTGGHIYPGLAVARVLQQRGCEVHWVGATGGLEEKILSKENSSSSLPRQLISLHLISIGKMHASAGLKVRLMTLFRLPLAFWQALWLAYCLKPDVVLGVGGYASGPFLLVSSLLGVRTLIWEPNAHAGLANRLLARVVDECLVVFEESAKTLKAKNYSIVGLPVRETIRPIHRESAAESSHERKFRVLVFGGSQGARAINLTVQEAVLTKKSLLNGVAIVHQTGRLDFQRVNERYARENADIDVTCVEYLHDMDAQYKWADIVVCRAGASTVAEIAACGKAVIFVPLPTAADNHQLKNARVLERAGGAVVIEQKDFTPENFAQTIAAFRDAPAKLEVLEQKVRQFAIPDAAEKIADHVLERQGEHQKGIM